MKQLGPRYNLLSIEKSLSYQKKHSWKEYFRKVYDKEVNSSLENISVSILTNEKLNFIKERNFFHLWFHFTYADYFYVENEFIYRTNDDIKTVNDFFAQFYNSQEIKTYSYKILSDWIEPINAGDRFLFEVIKRNIK